MPGTIAAACAVSCLAAAQPVPSAQRAEIAGAVAKGC